MTRAAVEWLVAASAPVWLFPLAWWLAFSPTPAVSHAGTVLIYFELFAVFGLFPAAAVLLVGPIFLCLRRYRRLAARSMAVAALFAASFVVGLLLRLQMWRAEIAAVADRGQPLVEAITAYTADNGRPPRSVDELVPRYIGAIPATGIGAWPEYRYVEGRPDTYDGNDWVLIVTPPCAAGFDSFLYFPRQNYPRTGYGGGIERIGGWGYVHE